jgi:hypothetical protein
MVLQRLGGLFKLVQAVVNRPQIAVLHGAVVPEVTLDFGEPGNSSGDIRLFSFSGASVDGQPVTMDWVMTTTGPSQAVPGAERRTTLGNFAFGVDESDQLVLQGIGLYPSDDSTFKAGRSLVRMITGGQGRFAGAAGQVLTEHFDDNTWRHTFYFESPQLAGVPERLRYSIGHSGQDQFVLNCEEGQPLDVVVNFSMADGDRLQLNRMADVGESFRSVVGRKGVRNQVRSETLLIYNEVTGGLYLNENGRKHGLGSNGGLLAVMDGQPLLSSEAFIVL